MPTFVAFGNIQTPFPFHQIPIECVPFGLRQENISPFATVQQRFRCRRLAHFLLWQLLKKAQKSTALLGDISRTTSGRPYFPDEKIDFNISHSGDWVAVVLHIDEQGKSAVGIDIEFPKNRRFQALMEYFAPKVEQDWFLSEPNQQAAFYRAWCLREAVLKSQGVGIVKLSNVRHLPKEKQIFSDYCPKGELLFSAELPVYFTLFINQTNIRPHFYQWNGRELAKADLTQAIRYRVN